MSAPLGISGTSNSIRRHNDVRNFADYRAFLLAHVQDCKRANPKWTYGMWAKRLGLQGASSITKVIQGTREPGPAILERLISYFEFPASEGAYFRDLVALHKVKRDPWLSALMLEKLARQVPEGTRKKLDVETFSLVANWYVAAIREMVRLDDFFEDPEWISKRLRFKVTPSDALRSIKLLVDAGLLKRDEGGRLELSTAWYETTHDVPAEANRRYHDAMLEHAREALKTVDVAEREYTAGIFSISTRNLPKAKVMIREAVAKISSTLEEQAGDAVYSLQVQFFPVTTPVKGRP
jgi:uncharacterized protein (TIGR02147 family)